MLKKRFMFLTAATAAVFLGFGMMSAAWAHAFPERSWPAVGSTIQKAPEEIKIRFTEELSPSSQLIVKNTQDEVVNLGEATITGKDNRILSVALKQPLPAGIYRVYWNVTATDGHHSEGHYRFDIRQETHNE
ncbi:MAG: copper resistance CopC family protein [Burkholderiales bacterium]